MPGSRPRTDPRREIRLALVMNGGVSLAVWMGGVTREIDNVRNASSASTKQGHRGTTAAYFELLEILDESVLVDVIAGASAGGINGILLGAAIATGKALPDLRETWIGIGDLRTLLRSPTPQDPPSILKGDEVVLGELREVLFALFKDRQRPKQERLYLYVTATDASGFKRDFQDSTGYPFEELDHRRTFSFQLEPPDPRERPLGYAPPAAWQPDLVVSEDWPVDLRVEQNAWQVLAHAARSTSSFPTAFEPHSVRFGEDAASAKVHWLIDGGILDNQPFNPVLDRIGVLPADRPAKRVVGYIVPYVNKPGSVLPEALPPTARRTIAAAGALARDLPKLDSFDRVTREGDAAARAEGDRRRLWAPGERAGEIAAAAAELENAYRRTRSEASRGVYWQWALPDFRPGGGVLAQDPALAPTEYAPPAPSEGATEAWLEDGRGWWLPAQIAWPQSDTWDWGFSVAERVATWALGFLRDAHSNAETRSAASELIWSVREHKQELFASFSLSLGGTQPTDDKVRESIVAAYTSQKAIAAQRLLQYSFKELDEGIEALNRSWPPEKAIPTVEQILQIEVVVNAFSVSSPSIPSPFDFVFMSAGVQNSLGHRASTPEAKLAGIKLNHFAGFLKRSWRANDWLWGRMDGVEHVLRALLDAEAVGDADRTRRLARFAFPEGDDGQLFADVWRPGFSREQAVRKFQADLRRAALGDPEALERCRKALAARIQLEILRDDAHELQRVAQTVKEDVKGGSNKLARGVFWASRIDGIPDPSARELHDLFCSLDIGEEKPTDELSSRLVLDVVAQAVAVAAGLVAGNRGGLPLAARSILATLRGVTLTVSGVVRLLAREPLIGAAVVSLLAAVVAWGFLANSILVGSLAPTLALAVVVGVIVLFTIATSALEESLSKPARALGFAVLVAGPVTFALLAGWPAVDGVRDSLHARVGAGVTWFAAALAIGTLPLSFGRFVIGALSSRLKPGPLHTSIPLLTIGALCLFVAIGILIHDTRLPVWHSDWKWPTGVLVCVAGVAAWGHAALEDLPGPVVWRRKVLSLYRVLVIVATFTLAGGFLVQRWRHQGASQGWFKLADEHRGIILVGTLLVVFSLSAILIELVVPTRLRRADERTAKKRAPLLVKR